MYSAAFKAFLIVSISSALSLCAFAQSGTLLIKTLADADGSPLDNAQVTVTGGEVSLKALSDKGLATFENVPSGSYKIEVSAPGFDAKSATPKLDYSKKPSYSGSFRLAKAKAAPAPQKPAAKSRPIGEVLIQGGLSPVDAEYMALKEGKPLSEIETEDATGEDETEDVATQATTTQPSPMKPEATTAASPASEPASTAATFYGIPRLWFGILAAVFILIIVADVAAFGLMLFFKWSSLGMVARIVVVGSWLGANVVLGIIVLGSVGAFLAATKSDAPEAVPVAAGEKPIAPVQAAANTEETLAVESFRKNPDEAGAQRLAGIREAMAREMAAKAIASNDGELYKQAVLYADSAATLSPADPKKHFLAGSLYARIANSQDAQAAAVERFEKACALAPDNVEARIALGEACTRIERNVEALDAFESVVAENPKAATPELVRAMALCYMKERLYGRCATFFGALLKADPQNDAARIALSAAVRADGDADRADAELKRVVSRQGAPPEMKAYAAKLLSAWNSGRKGGAE